jgi:hypothetical protein
MLYKQRVFLLFTVEIIELIKILFENWFLCIKGTVPRDFTPQLFFMKHISLGP